MNDIYLLSINGTLAPKTLEAARVTHNQTAGAPARKFLIVNPKLGLPFGIPTQGKRARAGMHTQHRRDNRDE